MEIDQFAVDELVATIQRAGVRITNQIPATAIFFDSMPTSEPMAFTPYYSHKDVIKLIDQAHKAGLRAELLPLGEMPRTIAETKEMRYAIKFVGAATIEALKAAGVNLHSTVRILRPDNGKER